jgi:LuxR family maltose regulon positive regulatory protein
MFIMGCAHYLQLGDVQAAEQTFQEALRLTQSPGDAFSQLQIYFNLSQMRVIQGRLRAAEMPCRELIRLATQPGWEHVPAVGFSHVMFGRILYERNDLSGALEALVAGIAEVEDYSLARPAIIGFILLARVKLVLGDLGEARKLLDRAWTMIQKNHLKQITIPAAAYRAQLLLALGDVGTVLEWAHEIESTIGDPLNPALEYDHMSLARVWLKQGRLTEAHQLLARLLTRAEEAGRIGRVIEILALLVITHLVQREEQEAVAVLERALTLAEPEGYVRTFVDEGKPMEEAIRNLRGEIGKLKDPTELQTRLMAYADKLLGAFTNNAPDLLKTREKTKLLAHQSTLVEPLSRRELEVLHLIADGLSNLAIAQKLFLSPSTVKVHIKHIYGKLDVNSRTQAVARLHELNLP